MSTWLARDVTIHLGAPVWQVAGILVALFAVLVALFKDEFWHRRHAPGLDLELVHDPTDWWWGWALHLHNPSRRMAAEGVTVRVIELHEHPLEASIGPRWMPRPGATDQLLPRGGGETAFGIPPEGEVRISLLTVDDGWSEDDAALARLATTERPQDPAERAGLLVLPSANERRHWSEQHPDLAAIMDAPALVRLEVAANNVPARLYTVKISRDIHAPPSEGLPMNPGLRAGVFRLELARGKVPPVYAPPAGQLPIGMTEAEWQEEQERELAERTRRGKHGVTPASSAD